MTTEQAMDFHGALVNEILPFWVRSVDREYGGYWCDIDEDGNRVGDGNKHIVTICRQIYTFSLGHRLTQHPDYLDYAAQGVDFFIEHFLDPKYGGFIRATDRAGVATDRGKFPYGEYFAIYSLAEYFRASGDKTALQHASDTYDLLEKYDWDHKRGGYYQDLNEDWSMRDNGKSTGHLLHAIEAVSNMYASTGESRYLDRLNAICDALVEHTWDPETGCQYEAFTGSWEHNPKRMNGLVLHGHTLECAALVQCIAAFTGNCDHMNFARKIMSYALRHGYDAEHGGVYFFSRPNGTLVNSDKMWWVQAEALSAISMAYRLSGDPFYYGWLQHLADFIYTKQRDARDGEWYSLLYADGTVRDGRKGWASPENRPVPAKGGYHVAKCLYHAARNLAAANGSPSTAKLTWADVAV